MRPSVLDKRRREEQQEMAAAEAAAAKRRKVLKPVASVATVVDPSLPAGVCVFIFYLMRVNKRIHGILFTIETPSRLPLHPVYF